MTELLQQIVAGQNPKTYVRIAPPESERVYPCYAQILTHVEWTEKMGLPVQNILQYENVAQWAGGMPDVFQLIQLPDQRPVTMTRGLQEWAFSLMEEAAPSHFTRDDVITCWASTNRGMRAYYNKTGWDDGFADYIQGINLDAEPMRLQPAISRGATVKVLRAPFWKAGIWQAEIECADAFDPKTLSLTWAGHIHLMFPAMNWSREPLPFGKSEPFPKLDGNDVPIPFLGNHTNKAYIGNDWLRYLVPREPVPAYPYWPKPTT